MKFSRIIVPLVIVLVAVALLYTASPPPASNTATNDATPSAQPASARQPVRVDDRDLAPKWNTGEKRRYLVFTRTQAENTSPGQDAPVRNSSELFLIFTLECVERNESGATLTLTYDRIRSTFRSPRTSIRSDTARDPAPPDDLAPDRVNSSVAYKRTIGVPVTLTLDEDLALVSASHRQEDFDDTIAAQRVGLYLLSEDGIRNSFGLIFSHTAEQSDVGVNETWQRYTQYEGPASNRWIDTEHFVIESEGGVAQIAITGTVQTAPYTEDVPDPDEAPEFPNLEGTYTWSIIEGSLFQAEITETFENESDVATGEVAALLGESVTVASEGRTNTVIRRVGEDFDLDELLDGVSTVPPAEGPRPEHAAVLDQEVLRARGQLKVPALGVAVVNAEGIVAFGIIGERNIDTGESVRTDDLFNLGFVTSNLTASAIAKLVTDGALSWDTAFTSEQIPGLSPAFAGANVTTLLQSRAGVPGFNTVNADEYAGLGELRGSATEQRLEAARRILSAEPATEPGAYATSAASRALAVALAEQATGKPWADLFHESLAAPLGLTSALFDWPATSATPDQPQGHIVSGSALAPLPLGRVPGFDPLRRPATALSMNLEDFATYASHELRALNGNSDLISQDNAEHVHAAPDGRVAMSWVPLPTPSGYSVHWNGSISGGFSSAIVLVPDLELGVVAVANAGNALNGLRDFAFELLRRDPRLGATGSTVGPRVTPTID